MPENYTRYVKFNGGYAKAVWIKSQGRYRLQHLWCHTATRTVEAASSGRVFSPEEINRLRRLKNKPTYRMVREAEVRASVPRKENFEELLDDGCVVCNT